jgi:hypothetical protein
MLPEVFNPVVDINPVANPGLLLGCEFVVGVDVVWANTAPARDSIAMAVTTFRKNFVFILDNP